MLTEVVRLNCSTASDVLGPISWEGEGVCGGGGGLGCLGPPLGFEGWVQFLGGVGGGMIWLRGRGEAVPEIKSYNF